MERSVVTIRSSKVHSGKQGKTAVIAVEPHVLASIVWPRRAIASLVGLKQDLGVLTLTRQYAAFSNDFLQHRAFGPLNSTRNIFGISGLLYGIGN